jgi:hypothetical protein
MWITRHDIKPYKPLQLLVAPLIGGPLAAAILLSKNYHTPHRDHKMPALFIGFSLIYTLIMFVGFQQMAQFLKMNLFYSLLPVWYWLIPYLGLIVFGKHTAFFGQSHKSHSPSTGQVLLKAGLCCFVNTGIWLMVIISLSF